MWLDEATYKWTRFDYYHKHYAGRQIPEQELADDMFAALDGAYESIDCMARVLRELALYFEEFANCHEPNYEDTKAYKALSDDVKELLR